MKISANDCRVMIEGNKQYSGGLDDHGSYEPCVMGYKCRDMRNNLAACFNMLKTLSDTSPYTKHLKPGFEKAAKDVKADILGTYHYVN